MVLLGHGVTTLGRTVSGLSPAEHAHAEGVSLHRCRTARHLRHQGHLSFAREIRRYRFAERIIYPTRADNVMHEEAAE